MMENKVEAFIEKHQLIEKQRRVIVGVSGGPDSMALLHFLWSRRAKYKLDIIAVGVDHQLRAHVSEQDMLYVKKQCKQWNIPFDMSKVDVTSYERKHKVGTQLAARTLRYEVFAEKMKQYEADYLALGHHGDDQIETMLMGMIRMTSLQGLRGIPIKRLFARGKIIRPLLPLTKEEIESYCTTYEIKPRIDDSNFETDYTRNELRLRVVPVLKDKNHYLHQTIQQLSETIQEDEAYIMSEAEKLLPHIVTLRESPRCATIEINHFTKHPVSLQKRVFRLTLNYLYKQNIPDKISYTHEQIFLQLLEDSTSNKLLHFPQQLHVEKSYNNVYLFFKQAKKTTEAFHVVIEDIPTQVSLPDQSVIKVERVYDISTYRQTAHCFIYPEAALSFPLHIRHRQAGDRMSYEGLQGSKKLKDIFIDDKVPRHRRDQIYLLTDDEAEVLWLVGMRKKAMKQNNDNSYIVVTYYEELNNEEGK